MSKSYSKIRHIQESNSRLEKRFVTETQIIDEKLNWKSALVGGALACGIYGCDPSPSVQKWDYKSLFPQNFLDSNFQMTGNAQFGLDLTIGGSVSVSEWPNSPIFKYTDSSGKVIASVKRNRITDYNAHLVVKDENGKKIGVIHEDFAPGLGVGPDWVQYTIFDASGKKVLESGGVNYDFIVITLTDEHGKEVRMNSTDDYASMWNVNIQSKVDKRLFIFIPAFIYYDVGFNENDN